MNSLSLKCVLTLTSILLALGAFSNAHAGVVTQVLECVGSENGADQSYDINIVSHFGARVGVPADQQTTYTATILQQINGKQVFVTSLAVVPATSRLASSAGYLSTEGAQKFSLSYRVNAVKDNQGRQPGSFTAQLVHSQLQTGKIGSALFCK